MHSYVHTYMHIVIQQSNMFNSHKTFIDTSVGSYPINRINQCPHIASSASRGASTGGHDVQKCCDAKIDAGTSAANFQMSGKQDR